MELIRLARRRFRPSQPHGEGRGAELRRRRGRRFVWAGITTLSVLTLVFVIATSARAATTAPHQVLALAASVNAVLNNIRNWIMGILAGLATVFLTLGGVRYIMAGGDPGEVEKAKTAFKSAARGYGLAALAPLVVQILKGIVGA